MSVPIAPIDPEGAWPSRAASATHAYLTPLLREDPSVYLDNAQGVDIEVLRVGDRVVPLVVCDDVPGKAAMLSPTGHYLDYPIHEIAKSSRWWTRRRLQAVLLPTRLLLLLGRIDRVVYVNHWLFSGGPALGLDQRATESLMAFVATRYPGHSVVVPNVNPALDRADYDHLLRTGCRMVQSRVVHLYDPSSARTGKANKSVRRHLNRERRVWHESQESRVEPAMLLSHTTRMAALYHAAQIENHTVLNPQYTERFFRHVITCGLFRVCGWTKEGKLQAFNVQLPYGGRISWGTMGYNPDVPREDRLYRLVMADDLVLADRTGAVLNWGAGVAEFKRYRGATATFEFDAVYDRHLPPHRRLPWEVIRRFRDRKYGIRHPLTDLTVDPSRYR